MQDIYVTTPELAKALGITERAVQIKAAKNGWPQEQRSRGRGRPAFAFLLSSLPADVRAKITLAQAKAASPVLPDAGVVIPDWAHRIGLDRYRLAHEFRAALAKAPWGRKIPAQETFLAAYRTGLLLPEVFARLGDCDAQTLRRWDKQLREAGDDYRVLCDRRGKWSRGGAKGAGQIGARAEQAFLSCWLTPNQPSVALAARTAAAILEREGLPVPSERSFARFAARFAETHHDLVTLKREGEKALKDKVGPFITRDDKILAVGDVIFCDGHVCNFEAIHPFTGKAMRPTLICWFDWRSRMPVGWEIQPSEDTQGISSALRMAVANLGKYPRVAYLDNGRAFKAKYFTADADLGELAGLYARLGIALQHSKPYEARTKIVERFFGRFNEECARILPSYCGASITDKPAWRARNERYHQARHDKYVPTLAEVGGIMAAYVRWYGAQPHDGLAGQKPWDVFAAGQGPGVDLAELNRHFLWTKAVTPRRCRISLAGIEFESDCLYGLKKEILAKYSCADLSEIHLFDQDGAAIGTAKPVAALNPLAKHFGDELDMRAVQEANKRQASLKSATLRLARELDGPAPGLEALPWMGKREPTPLPQIVQPKREHAPAPALDEAEAARLLALQAEAIAAAEAAPAYEAPAYFASALDRFDFLFEIHVRDGLPLTPADRAFFDQYEASDEYREATGERYRLLRELYAGTAARAV